MTVRRSACACAIVFALCLARLAVGGSASLTAASIPACRAPAIQAVAPAGTTITAATLVEAADSLPQYCRVEGHVATPGNNVNFRLGLPASWNGKFYFVGVGGLAGVIGSLDAGLARGYASASTDTGHSASDPRWGANRAKEIDYGHRGTHVTAVAAKALTAAYFGKAPAHAYFNGCSNGGRQALMEVQRYPADFDGVIAGDPATGTPLQVGRALVFQRMLLDPENFLPIEKVELLSRATLAACDGLDGLQDGLISDPRACTFKPQTLQCTGSDGPDCLTAAQIGTVEQIRTPLKTPDGRIYTQGLPPGHEGGATGWQGWIVGRSAPVMQANGTLAFSTPAPSGYTYADANMRFLILDHDDPSFSWRQLRFPADLPRFATMTQILSPSDPDLRPFKKLGGKIILYHGWADPAISAYGTIDYYEQMTRAVGGQREADAFSRLYLVPGMHHCRSGPGPDSFDMLPHLEAWVERGVAPTSVIATRSTSGVVDRTRPLCPHPQVARYLGSGSIDDAANFRCEAANR